MQVLGDLLKLPGNDDLPLPWWHRATMGLQSSTWCYVAVLRRTQRPTPDLIVSVLNPAHYSQIVRIRSVQPDAPGVISKVIGLVADLNIALAESATLETASVGGEAEAQDAHEVTLICEAPLREARIPSDEKLKKRFLEAGLRDVDIDIHHYPEYPVLWQDRGEIENGWIRNVSWRAQVEAQIDRSRAHRVDLDKAVVSADTTNRLVRFVFPLRDAHTIYVEHLDRPGVLKLITEVLRKHKVNILSMILRRGGARPDNAVLIAVCEPGLDAPPAPFSEIMAEVVAKLRELPPDLMIKTKLDDGVDCARVIAPRERGTVVARTPADLVTKVREVRMRKDVQGKLAVFFSHRFGQPKPAEDYCDAVRKSLRDQDCAVLELPPDEDLGGPSVVFSEVSKYLWAADAGIILLSAAKEGGDALGRNVPHEFGFLQGQAKPILLLVEGGHDDILREWTNIDGVYAPRFPAGIDALREKDPGSIYGIIRSFVRKAKERRGLPPD